MSDSRYYSLKQIAGFPIRYARETKTGMFLVCVIVSTLLTFLLRDPEFAKTQHLVLFLLFLSIGLWITEAIPPFAVGILIIGFLVFTMGREDTMDVKQYVQTWSDGVIWLFLGGFFLASGMKKTGLDTRLLLIAAPRFGSMAKYIVLGLMMVTAVLSMVMSNTATTAMMIATVAPLLNQPSGRQLSKILYLGIPAAAAIGGMGTIIGSAPNAIAVGALEAVGIQVSFIEWMLVGIPVALLLTLLFWLVLIKKYGIGNETLSLNFLKRTALEAIPTEEIIQKNVVLVILTLTVFLWLTSQWTGIPVAVVSGVPIVGLTMLGIIDADEVRTLPWDTLMLVAGGLSLGLAIQEQGLIVYFIDQMSTIEINFYVLLVLFSFISVVLSNFMSNTAATTILIPIAISFSAASGAVNPVVLPIAIGLCASCALLLPVSTPPNAIVYSTGRVEQSEFRLGGVFVGLLGPVLIILWTLLVSYIFF
ncbi:DASS family sodium-coupled anion symporter [Antarcticibacterium flavum]|uniref:DASS family sodium-coupled anion symporter n=1 Tax=Antarcticibacterium flavum TaxID=2058175 RepID=A0A5B7WYZ5_9FLAO|nr:MULTISPECIES: DASS family sodium-coupled anion symporter [Antarcticibacterium]MCM4161155.1 transporter [Antarcticibacterium sp. W02-3]QCY68339.1 DASS family sodium-coupled anion symporter [Antarcticibacterium flavum]